MLTFTSRITDSIPLEVAGLIPSTLAAKSLSEIERFGVLHGNRTRPLGEFFTVRGRIDDGAMRFIGELQSVHRLGQSMDAGSIVIEGHVGRHCGARMSSGEITVQGDAGDFTGCEMRGGTIRVLGNAGGAVGSAYAGSKLGMRGGTILVHGSAGDEVGNCMRRGLLAVGGSAGSYLAADMLAGSVLVFGACGSRPAANMRRGTVALLGLAPPLPPTFRYAQRGRSLILCMLLLQLQRSGFPVSAELFDTQHDQFHGDFLSLGRGEMFVPAA